MLAPLVDTFLETAKADLSDVESLHRMRLAGKRVRYAMELLAGAFDDSFRGELFVAFEEIQERLGTINDHVTAIKIFRGWLERAEDDGSQGELAERIALTKNNSWTRGGKRFAAGGPPNAPKP